LTKCERCGREFQAYCAKCRAELKLEAVEKIKELEKSGLFPVLWVDIKTGHLYPGCTVINCPCNNGKGICKCGFLSVELLKVVLHEWDGDNIVHNHCG